MADSRRYPVDSIEALEALARLLRIPQSDTGQSGRVASLLLAWHNAEENGGWNPVDLWQLDDAIVSDVFFGATSNRSRASLPGRSGLSGRNHERLAEMAADREVIIVEDKSEWEASASHC